MPGHLYDAYGPRFGCPERHDSIQQEFVVVANRDGQDQERDKESEEEHGPAR